MNSLKHVAIIMDGNGRWAKQRRRPRVWGHVRGSQRVSEIVESASDLGLEALTLYAFSTENWSRPVEEIKTLFKLLKKYLIKEREKLVKNNVQFKVIGDISGLEDDTKQLIFDIENETVNNDGLKLSFAFGYGGRKEIVDSINHFIELNPGKKITEEDIQKYLYRPEIGDVDLLIRTAGDQRISNFLLWQICYSEFYFAETKWPDFRRDEFENILKSVTLRERRFGSLGKDGNLESSQKIALKTQEVFAKGH
jgi:undecaprenyl diphosphate synthase